MAKEAAKTGTGPTFIAAVEHYFPQQQRIIEDDLAYRILPASARAFLQLMRFNGIRDWIIRTSEKDTPGLWGSLMCRKRYIDEKLSTASNQIDAVVNLGAGFDTRAYRLPQLADKPVWEVDQPENIHAKQIRLRKLFGSVPSHVYLVKIDFDHEDLRTLLEASGYSMSMRTFFIMEAVTQYLTEQGIQQTFAFLAQATQGSHLAFTYVRKDFLEGRSLYNWEKLYKRFVADQQVWLFGMEPDAWPAFLKQYGWQFIEDIGYDELFEHYIHPTGRTLASTPVERIVYAEKL